MIAVFTCDIIKSREIKAEAWLPELKGCLDKYGKPQKDWEIYRGDSFQLRVKDLSQIVHIALHLKASIKSIKPLDIKLAIGIGEESYRASKITESNGEAYVNAGELYERMQDTRQTIRLRSTSADFDEMMNLYLEFLEIAFNDWTKSAAELMKMMLEAPELTQTAIASKLGIAQPAVSQRYSKLHYDLIMRFNQYFKNKVDQTKF